jgi:Capsular polysaccharide biosynthesis protein
MDMATVMVMEMKKTSNLFAHFLSKSGCRNFELLKDMTDIHSHYLPGVDDGMKTFEETSNAISTMVEYGVKNVYFTPHIMTEYSKNHPVFLRSQLDEFNNAMPKCMNIRLAAEYMFDSSFSTHLENELLVMKDNHILVEMSYLDASPELNNFIYQLQIKDHSPILAHPERYMFMEKDEYYHLKEKGVKFQLNMLSLSGVYGKRVYDVAWYLLQKGMYNYCATDIHNYNSFQKRLTYLKLTNKEFALVKSLIEQNENLW